MKFGSFLIFLYSIIIEPITSQENKQPILGNLKIKLVENVSLGLMVSSISTEGSTQNCIRLSGLIGDLGINSRIIVKNELEKIQTSYVLGSDLEIVRSNINNAFFKIYYSEKFKELNDTGETPCNPRNYEKGLVRVNEYVFETKIIDLINEYENNYEEFKEKLEIPIGSEFWFSFEYNNGTIIAPEEVLQIPSINVYATEFPIQYVDKNANVLLGILRIKVW